MCCAELEALERQLGAYLDNGDLAGAARLVVSRLGPGVRARLRRQFRDQDRAEEVFSQALADFWRGLAAFRRDCPVSAWFFRVAWNAAARSMRDAWRRRVELGHEAGLQELATCPEEADASAEVALSAALEVLEALRAELCDDERRLLGLRVDLGLSWRDVAAAYAALGQPIGEAALRKRFERTKARLRAAIVASPAVLLPAADAA